MKISIFLLGSSVPSVNRQFPDGAGVSIAVCHTTAVTCGLDDQYNIGWETCNVLGIIDFYIGIDWCHYSHWSDKHLPLVVAHWLCGYPRRQI